MRDRDQDVIDLQLLGQLKGSTTQGHNWLAALSIDDFNVAETDAFDEAGTESLHDRFFGRPSTREVLIGVFATLAMTYLVRRVDPVDELLSVPLDHFADADNLYDVSPQSHDHRSDP